MKTIVHPNAKTKTTPRFVRVYAARDGLPSYVSHDSREERSCIEALNFRDQRPLYRINVRWKSIAIRLGY